MQVYKVIYDNGAAYEAQTLEQAKKIKANLELYAYNPSIVMVTPYRLITDLGVALAAGVIGAEAISKTLAVQYITREEYMRQLSQPDEFWQLNTGKYMGVRGQFDDEWYELGYKEYIITKAKQYGSNK